MNIEFEAVSEVKEKLNRTGYLSSEISENDKTPIWDGSIMIYKDNKIPHSKSSLVGRVPVQVKGRTVNRLPTRQMNFSVSLDDLRGFNSEGGAIYFLVYITEEYDKMIYYNSLLPIDLERLLQRHSKQRTVSIKFNRFPTDRETILSIFFSFLAHRKKQISTIDTQRLYLDKWEKSENQGHIKKYTVPITGFHSKNILPFEFATSTPQYIYISPKNMEHLSIPVDRIENMLISQEREGNIKIADKKYFEEYKIVFHEGSFSFHFSEGLTITFKRNTQPRKSNTYKVDINIKLMGTLKERIKDLEFFIDFFQYKNISIDSVDWPLEFTDEDTKPDLDSLGRLYDQLINLQIKLNTLNIKKDLDLDILAKNDYEEEWKLDLLLEVDEGPQEYIDDGNNSNIYSLEIANIRVLLFVYYEDNKRVLSDYYNNSSIEFMSRDPEGIAGDVPVSRFILLKRDMLTVSNFDYQKVYDDILKYESNDFYLNKVNLFLLEVIKAFDTKEGKKDDLYSLSLYLSKWLISKDGSVLNLMNYLQIIKRDREIDEKDIVILKQTLEDYKDNWEIHLGVLILLDKKEKAKALLSEQKLEDRSQFKKYPIYTLLQNNGSES